MARPTPNSLITRSVSSRKLPKTNTMIAAAAVITRAVDAQPVGDGVAVVAGAVVLLLDPREEEDLVVHREAEDDGEHHHRHERLDRRALAEADELLAPAPLEHGHDQPVGGADGQQVHHDGLERHEHRAEHGHQQQERQHEHDAEEDRQPLAEVRREVGLTATEPVTATSSRSLVGGRGATSPRRRWTSSVVAASWGAVVGITRHSTAVGSPGRSGSRARRRRRPRRRERAADLLDGAGVGGPVRELGGEDQRAVEAGSEALGEQVIGLPGGRCPRGRCPRRRTRGAATARGRPAASSTATPSTTAPARAGAG